MIRSVKQFGRWFGVEVQRYRPPAPRRAKLLSDHDIAQVLDVGASRGLYGLELRDAGFTGEILSFEPLAVSYELLCRQARSDPRWYVYNFGLSDRSQDAYLNVAGNRTSSSLLQMAELHNAVAPHASVQRTERVTLQRLDEIERAELLLGPVHMKIDVQGHEIEVLEGAGRLLERVRLIEVELSIRELYCGQPLIADIIRKVGELGFQLINLEPGFYDPKDGTILQFDGYFLKA